MPWSPGKTSDDKTIDSMDSFIGKKVVITEKMDGENTSIYPDGYCHARSINSGYHESRSYVIAKAAEKVPIIQTFMDHGNDLIFCGENLYAKHSIKYNDLDDYFYLFGVWEVDAYAAEETYLGWDAVEFYAKRLGFPTVKVLYEGIYDELLVKALSHTLRENQEGFVVRLYDSFSLMKWYHSIVKFVRADHVQTNSHWMHSRVEKNELRRA